MEVGEEGDYTLSPHCHHQNDSCIKMGSDESHFNVSLIVRDKVTRQCSQTTTFLKRKESHKCFINCEGQSQKTVFTNHNLSEEKGEP